MAGLEAEVNLTQLTETSATDDFDVDALLGLQHSDSYTKLLPKKEDNQPHLIINTSSKLNLLNDNNAADALSGAASLSPTGGRGVGNKNTGGERVLNLLIIVFFVVVIVISVHCTVCCMYVSLSFSVSVKKATIHTD